MSDFYHNNSINCSVGLIRIPWHALRERIIGQVKSTVTVDRSEKIEMFKAKRVRLVSRWTPQHLTLRLTSVTLAIVAI